MEGDVESDFFCVGREAVPCCVGIIRNEVSGFARGNGDLEEGERVVFPDLRVLRCDSRPLSVFWEETCSRQGADGTQSGWHEARIDVVGNAAAADAVGAVAPFADELVWFEMDEIFFGLAAGLGERGSSILAQNVRRYAFWKPWLATDHDAFRVDQSQLAISHARIPKVQTSSGTEERFPSLTTSTALEEVILHQWRQIVIRINLHTTPISLETNPPPSGSLNSP